MKLSYYWVVLQGTVLVNNGDKPLKWMMDLSSPSKALEEGIIKFLHSSGTPFIVMPGQETKGIEGILEPGKTQQISVIFAPSMFEKSCCFSQNSECTLHYIFIIYDLFMIMCDLTNGLVFEMNRPFYVMKVI